MMGFRLWSVWGCSFVLFGAGHRDPWCKEHCDPNSPENSRILGNMNTSRAEILNSVLGRHRFTIRPMRKLSREFLVQEIVDSRNRCDYDLHHRGGVVWSWFFRIPMFLFSPNSWCLGFPLKGKNHHFSWYSWLRTPICWCDRINIAFALTRPPDVSSPYSFGSQCVDFFFKFGFWIWKVCKRRLGSVQRWMLKALFAR